ncbi:hypothetical protein H0W32_03110 [Patescibacteria group bacterium]|nr:hypothetical protein [Patescibacteria group bacterium]
MQKKITVVIILIVIIGTAIVLILQRKEGSRNMASVVTSDDGRENSLQELEVSDSKNFILDLKDNDSTVTMGVGDELLIQLGTDEWGVIIDPSGVLEAIPHMPAISGVQGIYKAIEEGKVEIDGRAGELSFKAIVIVE